MSTSAVPGPTVCIVVSRESTKSPSPFQSINANRYALSMVLLVTGTRKRMASPEIVGYGKFVIGLMKLSSVKSSSSRRSKSSPFALSEGIPVRSTSGGVAPICREAALVSAPTETATTRWLGPTNPPLASVAYSGSGKSPQS